MARRQALLVHPPLAARPVHHIGLSIPTVAIAMASALALCGVCPVLAADGTWMEVSTTGSSPTGNSYGAIYDPINHRKILFAGHECHNMPCPSARVWVLDLATGIWTQPTPAGPTPPVRTLPAAIYDPTRRRMVTFGGGSFTLNDVWELQLPAGGALTWQEITTIGAPPPRVQPTAVYDALRDRMLLFGGQTGPSAYSNEVWSLDFSTNTWQLISPAGSPPSSRSQSAGVYDVIGDQLLIFGGYDGSENLEDTWQLSLSGTPAWTDLNLLGPLSSQPWGQGVLDPTRSRMLMLPQAFAVWSLNLVGTPNWSQLMIDGTPGGYLAPVYDSLEDRVLVERNYGALPTEQPHETWALQFDRPTSVAMPLARVNTFQGWVDLVWRAERAFESAHVERREESTGWRRLASLVSDAAGEIRFEDRDVVAGRRYAYRVAYRGSTDEQTTPETWVDVPAQAVLALQGPQPNPVAGDLIVAFSLPSAEPAYLEAYDISGRRVVAREVGAMGAGAHRVNLSSGVRLSAGVYTLRLVHGDRSVTARAIVVP